MIDLFLRADSESALAAALPFLRDSEGWISAGHEHALDVIGPVVVTPAAVDGEGNVAADAVLDGRCHANLRCSQMIADQVPAEVVIAAPATPARVWA